MEKKVSVFLSRKISHFSVVLTLWVIYIHYSTACLSNYIGGSKTWLRLLDYFGQGITRNAVPCFFIISGILAFRNSNINSSSDLLQGAKKRIRTLGVPYLFWNVVAMAFYLILDKIGNNNVYQISPLLFIEGLLGHKFLYSFWYVKNLFIFSVCAPILFYLIRSIRGYIVSLVVLIVIYFIFPSFATGLIFYVFGAGLAIHAKEFISKPVGKKSFIVIMMTFLLVQIGRVFVFNQTLNFSEARELIGYRIYELISPVLCWFAVDFIPFAKIKVYMFEKYTFCVYAMHNMCLSIICSRIVNSILNLPNDNLIYTIGLFFIVPITIYIAITLFSMFVERYVPRIYQLMTGGR